MLFISKKKLLPKIHCFQFDSVLFLILSIMNVEIVDALFKNLPYIELYGITSMFQIESNLDYG